MSRPRPESPFAPSPSQPLPPGEESPIFQLNLPSDLSQDERKRLEAEAREYERRCWVENGQPLKWDLLLRADPQFAEAVRAEGERVYKQAKLEIATREAREAALQQRLAEELRREARAAAAAAPPAQPALPKDLVNRILDMACRSLSRENDDQGLRRFMQVSRLANQIATFYRWPVIWNRGLVRSALQHRVANLRFGPKGNVKTSKAEILAALDVLIDVICDPTISPEETRKKLDEFMNAHTVGIAPPKDLMTKALEFTSAKSLWLKRMRSLYPGADSTEQGQKIPDFVSPFGPADNVKASGWNKPDGNGFFIPELQPLASDPAMAKKIEAAYASVIGDISLKVAKYKKDVIVTIDATTAPWMDAAEIGRRIAAAGIHNRGLAAVFLLKSGVVEVVWPPK